MIIRINRRVSTAAAGLLLGLAWSAAAHARSEAPPDWTGFRMSLGMRADQWKPPGAPTLRTHVSSRCKRWRAVALRLGETYAGHLIRQTVVQRECRFLDAERRDDTWDWPWASLSDGHVLPPRLYHAFGAWQIRCGRAGARRRCALITSAPASTDSMLETAEPAIVTHFVIDTVGGRESLLWRVFVPFAPDGKATASVHAADQAGGTPSSRVQSNGVAHYHLDGKDMSEPFPVCSHTGCLMEANVRHAGAVATRLSDGRSLEVNIKLGSAPPLNLMLPPTGFRAGLRALVRLRHEEARSISKH